MNTPTKTLFLAGSACLACLPVQGELVSDNFNSYTPGTNLDTGAGTAWEGGTGTFIQVAGSVGIGSTNAASIDVSQNVNFGAYTYQTTYTSPTVADSVTVSIDFQFTLDDESTNNNARFIYTGVSTASFATQLLPGVLRRYASDAYVLQAGSSGPTSSVADADMGASLTTTSGTSDWLRIENEITKTATTDQFDQTVRLYNLGSSVTGTPSLITSVTATGVSESGLYSASSWYSYIGTQFANDAGMQNVYIDNFSVVPEPSSYGFIAAFGALAFVVLRRRAKI